MTTPSGTDYTDSEGEPRDTPLAAVDRPPRPKLEDHRGQLRMAGRLIARHAAVLRFGHGLGWYVWDDTRWTPDRDGGAKRAAIETVHAAVNELAGLAGQERDNLYRDIRKSESDGALNGMLNIAAALHPIATAADRFDADPFLFNTTTGTLDLRTGEVRPPEPADLITKVAGCGLDQDADGQLFDKFLAEILPDAEVREFVQRLLGYSMLGRTPEHILPIFTGTGKNGKSTLLELLRRAFGDYAIAADPEMLVDRGHAHPTGQADLLGVRLAVASETDKGRHLAAATVKRLTGGDRIRARRMRENFFEFEPAHTIVMVTNHKPKVDGDDPALWRRILVVPFEVVIPEKDRDPHVGDRLALALPAVLRWAYDGYAAYTGRGLDPPAAVQACTREYQESSDALGRYLDERVMFTTMGAVKARQLFDDWTAWCHHAGEQAGTEKAFADALKQRGYEKHKSHGIMTYSGVVLLADDNDEPPAWTP